MSKLAWQWYSLKFKLLWTLGVRLGWILPYEQSLVERLRTVYYGGLPASVLLLVGEMCNGNCYDRATLITLGMEEFELVWGNLRGLELRFGKDHADHCWAESNGWAYDTSWGLRVKRWLYYLIETPKIRRRKNKDWCVQQELYQDWLHPDIEKDKYVLPLLLPQLEHSIQTTFFSARAQAELDLFKETIGYDQIQEEVRQDMIAKGFI